MAINTALPEPLRVAIMALTRAADVDPALAHAIRVRTNAGHVSADQADKVIRLLRQLMPPKPAQPNKERD